MWPHFRAGEETNDLTPMIAGSHCDCLICRLEKSLIAEFREAPIGEGYLAASGDALSAFPTYLDLIGHLHAPDAPHHTASTDALLLELLKQHPRSLRQRLLLLVFIPTIHRTASQITAMFPSLARDDISQQVVSVFLDFLHSSELNRRRSHVAFTIARKLRRSVFRWAIRESRSASSEDSERNSAADDLASEGPLPSQGQLHQFLDSCQQQGWLSAEERHLLVQFKIEGISCAELARQNGHSAIAIQRRIQRSLDRLRRLVQQTRSGAPEQLQLFTTSGL
ncbi:MAG: hypothetical protein ABSA57_15410 [Candidatus Acidiferrales bacterium]